MRLDKFLKVSRIIKRRTVANEACDSGRVQINGRPAKAGAQVKVGDEVVLFFGDKQFAFKILQVIENAKKQECSDMYQVITNEI
ncbi:MAG: RNA-binding S4 domain-containing protein [Clostridia bacterium]|nr:RNA-binding S4 domain-containing protein [Clostridia bacterium]